MTNLVDEDADLSTAWLCGGFVTVDPNGYGVNYRFTGNHSIPFAISSMHSCKETVGKFSWSKVIVCIDLGLKQVPNGTWRLIASDGRAL